MGGTEKIFTMTLKSDWGAALDTIQAFGLSGSEDPVYSQAVETFTGAFTRSLSGPSFPTTREADVAERILLFHSAGRIQIGQDALQMLVHRSLLFWMDDQKKRIGLARLLPEDAVCQHILAEHSTMVKESAGITVTEQILSNKVRHPATQTTIPLFRSRQEEEFYHAVRSFYPQHLIGVNVSIHAVINLESIRKKLSKNEIVFFFRGLLDIVTYDSSLGHQPDVAFEIDSPLHDDENQIVLDRMKDRILAISGLRLVRIRPGRANTNRRQFLALLRNADIAK